MTLPDSEPDTPNFHSDQAERKPQTTNIGSKHPRFVFSDDTHTFAVGDTEYSIHKYLLATHAPIWLDELNQTAKPIVLHDVQTSEMDALLSILYPSDVCGWDISSVEDWQSVLRLASRWHFQSFQKLAIKHLEDTASTSEKVILAREFGISTWLLPSLVSLCIRSNPLKLSEAENMPIADTVLVFTTRELIKTGQLRADTNVVSRHIQQVLDPQPAPTVPEETVRRQCLLIAEREPLPDLPPDSPIAATYEPEVLTEALSEQDYEKAVTAMIGGDYEDITRRLNAWISSSPANRVEAGVRDLAWAIVRGGACDSDFIPSAVRIFSDWKRDNPRYAGTIDGVLREATNNGILPAPFEQASFNPSSPSGRALYAPHERWLSSSEYTLRCRNARRFVAELARSGMIGLTAVCDSLPVGARQARSLYEDLFVLGPLLDVPDVKERLNQRLTYCDNAIWDYDLDSHFRTEHRRWMQEIYRLRKRGWVPENKQ